MSGVYSKKTNNEVSSNFKKQVTELEKKLINISDNKIVFGDGKEIVHEKRYKYKHTFGDGTYIRQMFIPKGDVILGAIHKHLHVWILLSGHITVSTEDSTDEYKAPFTTLSTPGVKRIIYAREDSVFTNIHKNPTNTQDIKELEKQIVALNYDEYEEYINKKNRLWRLSQ